MQSDTSTRANAVFAVIDDVREGQDMDSSEDEEEVMQENPLVLKQSSGSSGNEDFTGEGEGVTQKARQLEMAPLIKQKSYQSPERMIQKEDSDHSGSNSSGKRHKLYSRKSTA